MNKTKRYYAWQNKIKCQENQRKQALSNQNATIYYNLCNTLGIKPEDKHLYGQGYMEINHSDSNKPSIEDIVGVNSKYELGEI